jgi:MFS transporter, DHA1 family, multidrug resistance protein
LGVISLVSLIFIIYVLSLGAQPPLGIFMGYLAIIFFCFGTLFGNLNTLAVQPMGHIAGIASSVISSGQTLLSVVIGGFVGQLYNGSIQPLVLGFLICGVIAMMFVGNLQKSGT